LTVSGLKSGPATFDASFDPVTGTLALNFIGGLATDFYTMTLPGAASNSLGITGRGDSVVQFAVQPGDINGDGRTNDLDYFVAWANNSIHHGGLRGDLNGDGQWDTTDIAIVRSNYQKVNPGAPAPLIKKNGALAPWLSVTPLASLSFWTSNGSSADDILKSDGSSILASAPIDLSATTTINLSSSQQ
jgi:hypothetical protein